MLISSTTDYCAALAMHNSKSGVQRKLYLCLSLLVNLGLLLYFKYLLFAVDNANQLLGFLGVEWSIPAFQIMLPLGISFYTFQTISYSVDVYRGFVEPERDYVDYSVFVMYFPQLVAGPILRIKEVLPQLKQRPEFRFEYMIVGVQRILAGLFLKVVLADNIASIVDGGFREVSPSMGALDVWVLAFLFGFQIYFDFSAYSHIAIGSANLMGIDFPENFCFPYFAVSPRDFWRRWHISLSSWIRDYLYLPIAGAEVRDDSKGGLSGAANISHRSLRWTFALFITWGVMGLWHGAAWKFLLWGLWHAGLIQLYRTSKGFRELLPLGARNFLGWAFTLAAVMLSWIPFRATNLEQVFLMLSTAFDPFAYTRMGLRENDYLVAAIVFVFLTVAYLVHEYVLPLRTRFAAWFVLPETIGYAVAIYLVFVFLRPAEQFIYFQF